MSVDLAILLAAVALGGVMQVGIGIGFSVIVGPLLFLGVGAATAVPLLLLLNVVVSVVAVPGSLNRPDWPLFAKAVLGTVAGIVAGIVVYPYLSEPAVLGIAGGLLVLGALSTLLPVSRAGGRAFVPIAGLSGLATVWAATPGPLMALGLILAGRPPQAVRRLVQPVALIGYSVALALHGASGWARIGTEARLLPLLIAAVAGGLAGRVLGPILPRGLIASGIRIVSLIAGLVLLYRALNPV